MKTIINLTQPINKLRPKNTANRVFLFFCLFISLSVNAQDKLLTPIGNKEVTYTRYDIQFGGILYINSTYNEDEIRDNYPTPDPLCNEYLNLYVESNKKFVKIVNKVFSKEKIIELSKYEQRNYVFFIISNTGKPLMVSFVFIEQLPITPLELKVFEKELLKGLKFIPNNVNVKGKASTYFDIGFTFQEILDGNVKSITQNEKAYQKFLKGETL